MVRSLSDTQCAEGDSRDVLVCAEGRFRYGPDLGASRGNGGVAGGDAGGECTVHAYGSSVSERVEEGWIGVYVRGDGRGGVVLRASGG